MKRTVEEHATRFDESAAEYDEAQDSTEYKACASLVVDHARDGLTGEETVLDLGCGTGAIGLALAADAGRVLGRDISEGMMEQAREKAAAAGLENVAFEYGEFRDPQVAEPVDVVVSNFAMHHLSDGEKREAIEVIADLGARRFVLGDVMFFGEPDPEEPFYSPEVDDPSTVGVLADALTDSGFALTAVEMVHEQVGVLVAERAV
ncbi:class I SAM-dependent methyltransferase [Halorarius halobius]|uniref:class I SAM-dependent methyltransferase n=1 Tax=Halorarius halobius TaxID=2962671 RepID=UPI0020CDA875|nr:class I SAM-dependent methyltransferase [Halorarius halobius]